MGHEPTTNDENDVAQVGNLRHTYFRRNRPYAIARHEQ